MHCFTYIFGQNYYLEWIFIVFTPASQLSHVPSSNHHALFVANYLLNRYEIIKSYEEIQENSIITPPLRILFANEALFLKCDKDNVTMSDGKPDWTGLWKIEKGVQTEQEAKANKFKFAFKHYLYALIPFTIMNE